MRSVDKLVLLALLCLLTASGARAQNASPADVAAAPSPEARARDWLGRVAYEGVSISDAKSLDVATLDVIARIVLDPSESRLHTRGLLALGIAAPNGAYETIRAFNAHRLFGEVDRATYDSRLAVPIAMGHLARSDPRALAWLRDALARRASELPEWRFPPFEPEAIARSWRRSVISGLGLTADPSAEADLAALATAPATRASASDASLAREALRMNRRVREEGVAAVLRGSAP